MVHNRWCNERAVRYLADEREGKKVEMNDGRELVVDVEWNKAKFATSSNKLAEHVCVLCGRRDGDTLEIKRMNTSVHFCVQCGNDVVKQIGEMNSNPVNEKLVSLLKEFKQLGMPTALQIEHLHQHLDELAEGLL